MKLILAASTAAFLATAAFAAGPGDAMAPAGKPTPATTDTTPAATDAAPAANSLPASATPTTLSCADMITKARGMTLPPDATKAQSAREEIKAADESGDDATCRSHAQNALSLLGGG